MKLFRKSIDIRISYITDSRRDTEKGRFILDEKETERNRKKGSELAK